MSGTTMARALISICLIIATGGYIACSQHEPAPVESLQSRELDDGHGLHLVDNPRLRVIMHGLSRLEIERLQADAAGAAVAADADERIERVARSAAELAADARVLPAAFKDMQMNAESRRVFDNMSRRLQEQCLELEQLARQRKTQALGAKMNEITHTCNECHASFRGPQMALGKP